MLHAPNGCINFTCFFSKLGCRRCWPENNTLSGSGDTVTKIIFISSPSNEAMFLLVFVFVCLWASWLAQCGTWNSPFNFGCDLSQNLSFFERSIFCYQAPWRKTHRRTSAQEFLKVWPGACGNICGASTRLPLLLGLTFLHVGFKETQHYGTFPLKTFNQWVFKC